MKVWGILKKYIFLFLFKRSCIIHHSFEKFKFLDKSYDWDWRNTSFRKILTGGIEISKFITNLIKGQWMNTWIHGCSFYPVSCDTESTVIMKNIRKWTYVMITASSVHFRALDRNYAPNSLDLWAKEPKSKLNSCTYSIVSQINKQKY